MVLNSIRTQRGQVTLSSLTRKPKKKVKQKSINPPSQRIISNGPLKMELISVSTQVISPQKTLKINDFSIKTDDETLSRNIIRLYDEAMTDETKKAQLLKFLSDKIQCILAEKEWFIEQRQSTIRTIMLMKAMLNNAETEHIWRSKCSMMNYDNTVFTLFLCSKMNNILSPLKNMY